MVGEEEDPVVVDDHDHDGGSIGGPSHQVGVGAPLQQRNSRARVPQDNIDETIPEGIRRKTEEERIPEGWEVAAQEGNPTKSGPSFHKEEKDIQQGQSRHQKLGKKQQKKLQPVMNLAWLSMWWRRMERDAEKKVALEKERKNGDKLLKYFIKKPESSNIFVENSVGERVGGGDVIIGRHPCIDEPNEFLTSQTCQS